MSWVAFAVWGSLILVCAYGAEFLRELDRLTSWAGKDDAAQATPLTEGKGVTIHGSALRRSDVPG
jgi:hypothetical protein